MKELIFWNKWTTPSKFLYWTGIFVLFASIAFLTIYYLLGLSAILDWTVVTDIDSVEVTLDHVRHKVFDIPFISDDYVVFQYFQASLVQDNLVSATVYVLLLFFGACLALTVFSTYKNIIWFGLGSAFFTFWLAFMKLDLLGVFGLYNNALLGTMLVVYLGLSYLFHSWFTNVSFIKRFLSFVFVTFVFGLIILRFSSVVTPIVHLASFGVMVPCLVLFMFLVIIGYEIMQFMLSIMTMSKNSNPWAVPMNFLIVTILYVGNIVLYYLYYTKQIEWKLPYNVYLFFPICAVLGIWSHRKRSVLYLKILPFAPGGAFLYLSFAIISVSTLAYITSIGLTPAIKVFELLFIITQAAYGIAFFAYGIRNFYKPMTVNMPVHKMVYDPRLMPHYILRGLGIVLACIFIGRESGNILGNVKSSYFTLKGNWYKSSGEDLIAVENYKTALDFSVGSHLASYSLASLYLKQGNEAYAVEVLENVNNYEASEFLYATLSAAYQGSNDKMKQILLLKEAAKAFPNSPYIANNTALAYYKLGFVDSAAFYLEKALESKQSAVIQSNFLALAAKEKIGDSEQIVLSEDLLKDIPYMTNAYALANVLGTNLKQEYNLKFIPKESNGVSLSLVNNYLDNHLHESPKELLDILHLWNTDFEVQTNVDNLRMVYGKALFYSGKVKEGLAQMDKLTRNASTYQIPYYSNISAFLYIKTGLYKEAYALLLESDQMLQLSQNNFVRENCAIMALETGDLEYAKLLFPALSVTKPLKKQQYLAISDLLNGVDKPTEYQQAVHVLFLDKKDVNYLDELAKFPESKLKEVVLLNFLTQAIDQKDKTLVEQLWAKVPTQIEDKELYLGFNLANLRTLDLFGNRKELKEKLDVVELEFFDSRWKTYFSAKIAASEKDTIKASQLFESSLALFPENELVIFNYIDYLENQNKTKQAYEVCAEYLRNYPHTKQMLLKFVDLALANYLYVFADETVEELRSFMSPVEYESYYNSYKKASGIEETLQTEQ